MKAFPRRHVAACGSKADSLGMMHKLFGLSLLLLGLAPGSALAQSDAGHYRRCLASADANPALALSDAVVNLKRYADAGSKLDQIAGGSQKLDVSFRVELFDQAGNAWLLAGDGARAVQSFSGALALSAGDPDLFADLARAQAMRRNWPEVVLDLNAALQLAPRRPDLLVLRASARRAMKRYQDAGGDIEAALKLRPGDGDALVERGLLRRQLGDLGGARRDFEAALKTGSGNAAAQAKANLEDLSP
jgi:tetratricopeptide (TPR) repeat protein